MEIQYIRQKQSLCKSNDLEIKWYDQSEVSQANFLVISLSNPQE